mgnify:CR=1 FL=1
MLRVTVLVVTFLIALIGWMPSPIDLSAWSSIWIMEKRKNKEDFSFKDNVLDFNLSYIVTSILAIIFLILGANVFYGSGEEFAPSATTFVHQLVQLYASLGDWSKNIILLTALTTMLSTTLTCLDAFPKVLNKSFNIINQDSNEEKNYETIFLVFIILGTLVTIFYIGERMKYLVDLATILSFMTAPFLAYLNYKLIFNIDFPKHSDINKILIGDLAISLEYIKNQNENKRIIFDNEIKKLIIHGILHLNGYDHENIKDEKKMTEKQNYILNKIKY